MLIVMAEIGFQKGITTLSKKYPNECMGSFPNFLVDTSGKLIVEKDGSLPKRITFLGHCYQNNKQSYNGYSSEQFVAHFVKQLEAAIKINPKIKDSIACIDLLGCNTGFVSKQGHPCFAQQVATLLEKAGYDIQVKAVTNLGVENPKGWDHMSLSHNSTRQSFRAFGFSSIKDRQQFEGLMLEAKKQVPGAELRIKVCYQVIMVPTTDIRETLDQNPHCNFSLSTIKENTAPAISQATNVYTLFTACSPAAASTNSAAGLPTAVKNSANDDHKVKTA